MRKRGLCSRKEAKEDSASHTLPSVREDTTKGKDTGRGRVGRWRQKEGRGREKGWNGAGREVEGGMVGRKTMQVLCTFPVSQIFPMHPRAVDRPIL